MKRFAICFALLTAMLWPLTANAGAKAPTQAATINLVGVNLASPDGLVHGPWLNSFATVTGTSFTSNLVVSYVRFWVDLPQGQIDNPQPYGGCPTGPTTCQFMGQDVNDPYSLAFKYGGRSGRHTATVQVWRDVAGDTQPILLGQDSNAFCLNNCSG